MRIRFRVLAALVSCAVLALYLGFANISLPHDKLAHFSMFFLMSLLFYWVLESKNVGAWTNVAFVVCTLVGGIGSEFLQHLISPFRSFDVYDIVANVLGSSLAIGLSSLWHRHRLNKRRASREARHMRMVDVEAQLDTELQELDRELQEEPENNVAALSVLPPRPLITTQPKAQT